MLKNHEIPSEQVPMRPTTATLSQAVVDNNADRVLELLALKTPDDKPQVIPSQNIVIFAEQAGLEYAGLLREAYDNYINACATAVCASAESVQAQAQEASGWRLFGLFQSEATKNLGAHKMVALGLIKNNLNNATLVASAQPDGELGQLIDTHRDRSLDVTRPTTSRIQADALLNPDADNTGCGACRPH